MTWRSPNHGPRAFPPDMIVMHYTGMKSAQAALERLCDRDAGVSAHYLVDEKGHVLELVDPARRAWHAGVSEWEGVTDVNSRSIGIEIVNPGHEHGYVPFPDAQIEAVISLARSLVTRYRIARHAVWGHSDVAPGRKIDPGELFPWARLARAGLGIWPGMVAPQCMAPEAVCFHLIGYGKHVPRCDIRDAFKRHFRPHTVGQDWTAADGVKVRQVAWALNRVRLRRRA